MVRAAILQLALMLPAAVAFVPSAPLRHLARSGARHATPSMATYDPTGGESPPLTRNNNGDVWVPQMARPRRNRKSKAMRSMVSETTVSAANFIYPLFIHNVDEVVDIASMPGAQRHSLPHMLEEISEAYALGVRAFILFPKVCHS
jgi:hypothetical protein